jgi:hypothetical protein
MCKFINVAEVGFHGYSSITSTRSTWKDIISEWDFSHKDWKVNEGLKVQEHYFIWQLISVLLRPFHMVVGRTALAVIPVFHGFKQVEKYCFPIPIWLLFSLFEKVHYFEIHHVNCHSSIVHGLSFLTVNAAWIVYVDFFWILWLYFFDKSNCKALYCP